MSDKPIGVGDLVIIVRWPHKCAPVDRSAFIGLPFTVSRIWPPYKCNHCNEPFNEPMAEMSTRYLAIPLSWLKRIDPDALRDDIPTKEELTA